jgi:hypothetical protein
MMAVFSVRLRPGLGDSESINPYLFGAIQTGFQHFSGFRTSMDELGLTHVRWPGGTLSEQRPEVYGLDVEGLFNATELYGHDTSRVRPDLREMLQYAIARDVPLTVILPTVRYASDIAQGVSHVRSFMSDLLSGQFGELPERLILQIGNEYAFQPEFASDPALYGRIANTFILTIEHAIQTAQPPPINRIDVAVQMGLTHSDDVTIRGEISAEALVAIDALTFHHLPISLRNAHRNDLSGDVEDSGKTRFERTTDYYQNWIETLRTLDRMAPSPELYLSAWTVGSSAIKLADVNPSFNDYGLPAASTAIDLIYNYARIGVDMAAVWGVDVINLNRLTLMKNGELSVSPYGMALGMMANSLVGSVPLAGAERYTRNDLGNIYAFQAADKLVIYATVNDIPESGTLLTVQLDGVAPMWNLAGRLLELESPSVSLMGTHHHEVDANGVPSLRSFTPIWIEDALQISFSQDFSVAEVIIDLPQTAKWGTPERDRLIAWDDDSFLFGFEGDDILEGGKGNDYLHGGPGNDILSGGPGLNTLIGGAGADQFVFHNDGGHHTIPDFEPGIDVLNVSQLMPGKRVHDSREGEMISALLGNAEQVDWLNIRSVDTEGGATITFENNLGRTTVHLENLDADALTVDDFWFF